MNRVLHVVLALTVASACGGTSGQSGARSVPDKSAAAATQRFPALRFAPKKPTYALVSTRTVDMVNGAREFMSAVGLLIDVDFTAWNNELWPKANVNPLSADSLSNAGIDANGSAVLFSTGLLPTLVVPVADPERLTGFIAERLPKRGVQLRQYRGRDWFAYQIEEDLTLQWLQWDGYLALRFDMADVENAGWLDDLFDETRTLAHSRVLQRALRTVDERVEKAGLAGLLDLHAAFRALGELAPSKKERKKLMSCIDVFAPLSGAVAIGADLDWSAASGSLTLGLTPEAASALRANTQVPPPGYRTVRDQAGLYASLGVDPAWLEKSRAALDCALWDRPLIGRKGSFHMLPAGLRSVFGAVTEVSLEKRNAHGVGYLGFHKGSLARTVLDMIPQRRLLERDAQVAGQPVKVIAVPFLPPINYRLDDSSLLLSIGKGVMEQTLTAPAGASSAAESSLDIASLGIYPQRLGDLKELLRAVAMAVSVSTQFAAASYRRLARYEFGKVDITLEGNDLVIRLAMRLAQQ